MSKKSRKEAEQPDAFITFSDKVIKWVEVHYRSMFTFIGVIVVGGALLAGYQFFSKRSEMKAMQALYGYEKKLSDKIEQLEKSDAEGIAEESEDKDKKVAKNEDSKKLEKTPEVLKQNLAEEISELKNFISSHKGTRAAFVGRLTVAQTYSDFGMDQEALEVLNQGTTSFSKDSLFYGLIHQRIGAALASVDQCESANEHFIKITEQASLGLLHPEAYLNTALCYEKLKQLDKAEELYKKVASEFSETDAGRSAKTYSRLLKMKTMSENR